jgi:hypothetical protein
VSFSGLKRFARICGLIAGSALVFSAVAVPAVAQAPAAAPPPGHGTPLPAPAGSSSAGSSSAGNASAPGEAEGRKALTALEAKKAQLSRQRQQRANPTVPTPNSPHGARRQGPRIVPATDLAAGDIQVMLTSKEFENIENQEVTLIVSKQSIERGNVDTSLTARTDSRGVALFTGQPTESDHVYDVQVAIGEARYSTGQFQFKAQDTGLRALVPIYKSSNTLDNMLVLTRTLIALVPQDNMFVVDVLFRVENYGEVSWLPQNVVIPLPPGFKALTVREPKADGRFEPEGDTGVKLVGTMAPGQHDLMFRFHLPTEGEPALAFKFPTSLNTGMVRVILESSPTMRLEVPGFPEPEESRNQEGQRRLVAGRDFIGEKARAPDDIEVKISGIPTPAAGRTVAVVLAGAIALGGLAQAFSRKRSASPVRSDLSKEDRERASELILEELIALEQAFQQGSIGRKTHEQAKRQLLEAFARLRSEPDPAEEVEERRPAEV